MCRRATSANSAAVNMPNGATNSLLGRVHGAVDDRSVYTPAVPASTVFDAVLSYDFGMRYQQWKGLSAAVNVNNVFDKTYVSLCTAGGCRWALGRTVLATLTYRW